MQLSQWVAQYPGCHFYDRKNKDYTVFKQGDVLCFNYGSKCCLLGIVSANGGSVTKHCVLSLDKLGA